MVSATGYADKVLLKVLRPETLADTAALSYKVCTTPPAGLLVVIGKALGTRQLSPPPPSPCHASYVSKGMHSARLPCHDT